MTRKLGKPPNSMHLPFGIRGLKNSGATQPPFGFGGHSDCRNLGPGFHAACKTKEEVTMLWKRLSAGGSVLMELGAYPFSEKFGWVQDRFGLSWQLIFAGEEPNKEGTLK
jgi:hypothetical protein